MKVLIAPDKFKGSLTGAEVIDAVKAGLRALNPDVQIQSQLLADGGEGTLEIIEKSLDLKRVDIPVNDPLGEAVQGYYLIKGESAYIEMAQASGLLLLPEERRNPLYTTTFGTGQMILDALDKGAKSINLFVGGSATNDCGLGMARALGFKFYDFNGNQLEGRGDDMGQVEKIEYDEVDLRIEEVSFNVLTDVQNPLLGENGAAYVYGKQKGADQTAIESLEGGANHLVNVLSSGFENKEGAGAAGGLGYGAMTFLNARVQSGINFLLELTNVRQKVDWADLVITGEGSIDYQTLEGKVIAGLSEICDSAATPLSIICGISSLQSFGSSQIYQIMDKTKSTSDAMTNAGEYVKELAQELLSDFRA